MKTPKLLKKNDTIGIAAPAKFIPQNRYQLILDTIEKKGFRTLRGKTTYDTFGPFAGKDEVRLADVQEMLDHEMADALFCLRGGYGSVRIIDDLDFSAFKNKPKWLVGYSDITVFHNALTNLGIESIHGQMPVNFKSSQVEAVDALFHVLQGGGNVVQASATSMNRKGEAKGSLTGGNLAILGSLMGTPYEVDTTGKILFIEEVGEYLYRFDRIMHQLKLGGKLDHLAGLIVGGLTGMEDNSPTFGQTAKQIVQDLVRDYDYPVCYDFPAGHIDNNFPLIMGRESRLTVNENEVVLKQ